MPSVPFKVFPCDEALALAIANRLVSLCQTSLAKKDSATIALTGGKTVQRCYEILATPEFSEQLDWNRIHVFWSDERAVPPHDEKSNFRMAWQSLFSRIKIPLCNLHRLRGEFSPKDAAEAAQREILSHFALPEVPMARTKKFPSFDLALLGVGEDAHIASLFPGHSSLDESEKLVVATQEEHGGARRITFTLPLIAQADVQLFLASGGHKAQTLQKIFQNVCDEGETATLVSVPSEGVRLPAHRLSLEGRSPEWLVDTDAAALLPRHMN